MIRWKPSSEGFVESRDGRWKIVPLYWGCVNPQRYELRHDGKRISDHDTQRDAKAAAAVHPSRTPTLTPAQQRTYDAIKAAGEKRYTGHKGGVLRNLRALGLVVFDYDLIPNGRDGFNELYIARLTNASGQRATHSRR